LSVVPSKVAGPFPDVLRSEVWGWGTREEALATIVQAGESLVRSET
jgi:hypothetical protein